MESTIALLMLVVAVYGLAAARLDRLSVGPALFFVAVGAAAVSILGPSSLPEPLHEAPLALVEAALVLVLFTDASTLEWRHLREEGGLVARLLAVGLLLAIGLGSLLAFVMFPELPLGVVLLLGAALAPTDAALGQPVVTNRAVPVKIRRVLGTESGLNDGIATPFVVLALSLISSEVGDTSDWLAMAVREGIVGVLVGVVVGGLGGWLLVRADRAGWTRGSARQLTVVALALGAYLTSVALGGNGFIAAFVGGLAFGAANHRSEARAEIFAEALGSLMSIAVWLLAGVLFAGPILALGPDPRLLVYAILSLTVVRMLPVAISLIGTRLRPETVLFVGWFGPRGLASIVFGMLGAEALRGAGLATDLTIAVIGWTVILSVVLHGLSAGPLAARYGRLIAALPGGSPEAEDRPEPRIRHGWAAGASAPSVDAPPADQGRR